MPPPTAPTREQAAGGAQPAFDGAGLTELLADLQRPFRIVREPVTGRVGLAPEEAAAPAGGPLAALEVLGRLPPVDPARLGEPRFLAAHGLRLPYVTGAMAHGIAGPPLVIAMGRAGMLGILGTAGLPPEAVERALTETEAALGRGGPFGVNLIHSPADPALEERIVDILLARGVRRVSASAFMGLSPAAVRYAARGLRRRPDGGIDRANHLFIKLSRPEVARHFLAPPPAELLDGLTARGALTAEEARLAAHLPVASHVTVEADSGGHTDNRPLVALLPAIAALRDELHERHGYLEPIPVGAAGGIATPAAVAAAFAMGAAYVVTGSINQGCLEASTSEAVKRMLAAAEMADVAMAPAADMFELGVKVQVLKRGTMFAQRAARLYELYRSHGGLEELPAAVRARLERDLFRAPLEAIWEETRRFFAASDPAQVARAEKDPRHRMALVFRWYLGMASRWARQGDPDRRVDYQVWCGPAMGAFNAWAKGSFLEDPTRRSAVQVGRNLLEGAAALTRAQQARALGVPAPAGAFRYRPRPLPPQTA